MVSFLCPGCGHETLPRLICNCKPKRIDARHWLAAIGEFQEAIAIETAGQLTKCQTLDELAALAEELKTDPAWLRGHDIVRDSYRTRKAELDLTAADA